MIRSDTNSCLLSVSFDWSEDDRTGKVTTPQEAYKYDSRRFAQGGNDEESYPYAVIDTKLRMRGAGRVMKVRYESSMGKDFILLGYSVYAEARTETEASK